MSHQLGLIVPPHSIRFFEQGEHCSDPQTGDLVLVDHGTWQDNLIQRGQEALTLTEPDLRGYTWCAHTAFVRDGSTGTLSEMGFRGYERRPLSDYAAHLYAVVNFTMNDEQRATMVSYDDACVGVGYGFLEYLPLIFDGLTDATFGGSFGDSLICSHHLTLLLMGGGLFPDRQADRVVPARLALWSGAER